MDNQEYIRRNYISKKRGAFFCWNMCSFYTWAAIAPNEVAPTNVPVNNFAPTGLNLDDWLDIIVQKGFKYVILTIKHHDGFVIYPTLVHVPLFAPYGLAQTAWYAAHGNYDITENFIAKAKARGLAVGLYFSIWDLTYESRSGTDQTTDTAGYIAMITAQLTELLTWYGNIDSLWFDGWQWHIGYNWIPYNTIFNVIKALQSNCVIVDDSHTFPTYTSEIETHELTVEAAIPINNIRLAEDINTIRNDSHWFYHSDLDQSLATLYTAAQINAGINQSNLRGGNYLLDISPGIDGELTASQKTRLLSL